MLTSPAGARRIRLVGASIAVVVVGFLLATVLATALDLGGRSTQVSVTWAAQAALYIAFAWHIWRLSNVDTLSVATRRFWRTVRVTGLVTATSYTYGALHSLTAAGDAGAATTAVDAGIGSFGLLFLVYACVTYRRDVRTTSTQLRRWIDIVTTMVAALGALWFLEATSLLARNVSPLSIIFAILVEALALVTVLALVQPTGTSARAISMRGGTLGILAILAAVVVEVLIPHAIGHSWLRGLLACRVLTPALAVAAVWLERVRPARARDAPIRVSGYARSPYTAVLLTYVLLALAIWAGHSGRTWGMFAAASIVTALVVVRQSLAFKDNAALVQDLQQAVTAASALTDQLHRHAFYDNLTGLPNRALFADRLQHALTTSDRSLGLVGVMVIDLDDFKLVNDRSGHAAGDSVLREAANRLQSCVRAADTVGRLGGDEFAVVLVDTDEEAMHAAADRIVDAFAAPFAVADGVVGVGVSVGTAISSGSVPSADGLLRHADIAMYDAKASGKRRHETFRASMLEELMARHDTRDALLRALVSDEILVHYQPIVDALSREVVGVEALARWERPGHGLVPPDRFLPLAEQIGVISTIDLMVLRKACEQVRVWNAADHALHVHVNISAITLGKANLLATVREIIYASGIRPDLLTLELTETALMVNPDAIIETMHALRLMGVRVAIDDFGTGYSSLAYLRDLPLDTVKMDRSFVERISHSEIDRELVRMIVTLAATLGLDTVAEGVEHAHQADFLSEVGCRHMQGHLFSAAVPAAEVAGCYLPVRAAGG